MAPRDEFLKHFEAYISSGAEKSLDAFVKELRSLSDVSKCLQAYFDVFEPYGRANQRSLRVFRQLAERALDLGDRYFAVRVEILYRLKDQPWRERYEALKAARQHGRVEKLVASKTRGLSRQVREFLKLFHEHMTLPEGLKQKEKQKEIERDSSKLMLGKHYGVLQDCLQAYMEASQAYKDGDRPKSVLIFYGLSHAAIAASPPAFAVTYAGNIKEAGSIWKKRYDALADGQRSFIDDDLNKKLTTYKDVKYKDKDSKEKTYRQPVRLYEPAPVDAQKAEPSEEPAVQPETGAEKDFEKVLRELKLHGLAKRESVLREFLRRTEFQGLRRCVFYYLRISERRSPVNEQDANTVFFALLSTAIAKGDAYYAYKVEALIDTAGTVWAARFAELGSRQPAIRAEIDGKRKTARFLDELRYAYYLRHKKDAADLAALRAFEPADNPDQTSALSKALTDVEIAASVYDTTAFGKSFDAFTELLRAQKDRHLLLVLMKRCRERRKIPAPLRHLLYLYGVGLLYQRLLGWRALQYVEGFNAEERDFLLTSEQRADRYHNDFVLCLEHVIRKKLGDPGVAAACKAQGALHLYAWKRDMKLTPMKEGAVVRKMFEVAMATQRDSLDKVRIPIKSDFGKQTLRIGQMIGGNCFIVWWDPVRHVAFVQLKDFGDIVFEMDSWRTLGDRWDRDAFYGEVYRSTKHLLGMIETLFEVLGYLPSLMSGGVSGLIIDVVVDQAIEKTVKALGIDPMVAQVALLGLGLVPRGGAPKRAVSSVEPDFSDVQRASIARMADRPTPGGHGDKAINTPLKADALGGGGGKRGGGDPGGGGHGRGGDAPPPRGTDMRGVETGDGHIMIRGDDSPAINAPKTNERVLDRGLQGDRTDSGIRIRGEADAPTLSGKDEMLAAQRHVDDLTQRIKKAERDLDQTQHSAAGVKDQLEIATNPDNLSKIKNKDLHEKRVNDLRAKKKQLDDIAAKEAAALDALRRELPAAQESARRLGSKVLGELNLLEKPTKFRKGAVEADSLHPSAYIGATDDRRVLERLLREEPQGDLSKALLAGGRLRPPKGGKQKDWADNPDIIELAHIHSKREGGRDAYIVMSKDRNQKFSRDQERTGGVMKDDVISIQGIAIDRLTALELVKKGKLPASAVANAPVIQLVK